MPHPWNIFFKLLNGAANIDGGAYSDGIMRIVVHHSSQNGYGAVRSDTHLLRKALYTRNKYDEKQ